MTLVLGDDGLWVAAAADDEEFCDPALDPGDAARTLRLEPHPEGGFFREVYRSQDKVSTPRGWRSCLTCALFMVTSDSPSHWHRLRSDEVIFYQAGAPVEHYSLTDRGRLKRDVLGPVDLTYQEADMPGPERLVARVHVPPLTWQAARLMPYADEAGLPAARWGLMACCVAPGFDFEDFELGGRRELFARHHDVFARLPLLSTLFLDR